MHKPGNISVCLIGRTPPWQHFQRTAGYILEQYERALRDAGSPIAANPEALRTCLANAGAILAGCVQSLRYGRPVAAARQARRLATTIGRDRAAQGIHPGESIRAAVLLVDIVTEHLAEAVRHSCDAGSLLATAIRTLNHAVGGSLRDAAEAYDRFLYDRIKVAQTDHTRTVAREIHDHLGNGMSLAYRHLEMYEALSSRGEPAAHQSIQRARDALAATLDSARLLITDLRARHPRTALREAVEMFIDGAGAGSVDITVAVLGDEQRLTDDVSGELFTIVRETLRNAIKHADPTAVSINIDITGTSVTVDVVDDGTGFDTGRTHNGHGLVSMTERTQLLGGQLRVRSSPGAGTRITVHVPLIGDEH